MDPMQSMHQLCSRAIDRAGPHHVAYFRQGHLALSVGLPEATTFERTGRDLDTVHSRLDRSLRAVSAGSLRRMMVRVAEAAVFYDLVSPGECVVTTVHGQDDALVDQTDCRSARLAGSLRELHQRLSDEFPDAAPPLPLPPAERAARRRSARSDGALAYADEIARSSDIVAAGTLDLVARGRGRRLLHSSDLLDHLSLRSDDPDTRRRRFADVGRLLHITARHVHQAISLPGRTSQAQLVADVDGAAVVYVHLQDDDFLVGVTLDPHRVAAASQQLRGLAESLRDR